MTKMCLLASLNVALIVKGAKRSVTVLPSWVSGMSKSHHGRRIPISEMDSHGCSPVGNERWIMIVDQAVNDPAVYIYIRVYNMFGNQWTSREPFKQ